ncbi:hypothetical protein K9L16_02695 [Candidatus Pacearchaeota archaeon]|nr:hypothetical protein [Candidatus Pacearchaeota archaeon]
MVLVPILLISNVIVFYLLIVLWGRKIIFKKERYENRKDLENHVFDELLKKDYEKINPFFSVAHWILIFVTAIILYQFRQEFIMFVLFWYLILGFIYNLLSLFLTQFERIKKEFKS